MSPLGRHFFKAQGASPGLIIDTYLLSPVGAANLQVKTNAHAVVPLLVRAYVIEVSLFDILMSLAYHCK